MCHDLEMQITKLLQKKNYLRKNEEFKFKISEEVMISSYNNDLYVCRAISNNQKVTVYWGDIKRRNHYCEIYLAVVAKGERFLTIIRQGILEYQGKI